MTTKTTTTTQPAIDLTGCKPGDRVKCEHCYGFCDGSRIVTGETEYRILWDYGAATFHKADGTHIYEDGNHVIEILPDPRDEEIARLKRDKEILVEEWNAKHSEMIAANAKVEGLERSIPLVTDRTRSDARKLLGEVLRHTTNAELGSSHGCVEANNSLEVVTSLLAQIAQLTKERDELRDMPYFKLLTKAHEKEATHTAELARVLTAWFNSHVKPSDHDAKRYAYSWLQKLKLSDRFRWNGDGFEAICKNEHVNDADVLEDTTSKTAGNYGSPPEKLIRETLALQKELQGIKDPLDAPVTRRELAQLFKGMQKAVPGNQRIRFTDIERTADKLEGGQGVKLASCHVHRDGEPRRHEKAHCG